MISPRPTLVHTLAALDLTLLAFSRIGAFDGATWKLEIAPVLLGGHFSYAGVPLGAWPSTRFMS